MLPIPGQNRLTVVMDKRKVEILKGAELQKELVSLLDAKFLPLIGLNLVDKTATRVIWNFLQKQGKGMGIRYRHTSFI